MRTGRCWPTASGSSSARRWASSVAEKIRLPFPVATDQLRQLKHDNIGPLGSVADGFGFEPRPMEGGLTHLRQKAKDQEPPSV